MTLIKKYLLYLGRWQLSSPILMIVIIWLAELPAWIITIIANLIGGLIFFWIDRIIFKPKVGKFIYWEIEDNGKCVDCNYQGEVRRVVINKKYDRQFAKKQFRCKNCAQKKLLINGIK